MAYNSTIIPKKKQLTCGHFDYAFSRGRCAICSKKEDFKPIAKVSKKRLGSDYDIKGGESFQNLTIDCDRLFSLVVRISQSDSDGASDCFTCGIKGRNHYKNMHLSHYIPRGNMFLRFSENNSTCSCASCNLLHNDNTEPYKKAIIEHKGKGVLEYLEEHRHTVTKWTLGDLKDLRTELQERLNFLQLKFKK